MRPLLLFGVLYVFFVVILNVNKAEGAAGKFYGVQLLGSIVLFTCFSEGGGAVRSVVDRETLVRKIQFPRLAIPISVVLLAAFNLGLNLLVVMAFALISGVRPMLELVGAPADRFDADGSPDGRGNASLRLVRAVSRYSADLGSVQSDLVLRLAGDHPGGTVQQGTLSHGSLGHASLYHVYTLNPLVAIFQQFRHAMVNHATLSAGQVMGSWAALLEPMALVAAVLRTRLLVFNREAPHIAEDL